MPQTGTTDKDYPLIGWLRKWGIPVTRENYLKFDYPDGAPDPMPAELDVYLPPQFRTGEYDEEQ